MKKLINFYALIVFPLSTIIVLAKIGLINSFVFTFLLLSYAFIYHPLISGVRLIKEHKISKQQLVYNFIPGWNWKYFAFLFFNARD